MSTTPPKKLKDSRQLAKDLRRLATLVAKGNVAAAIKALRNLADTIEWGLVGADYR